MPLPGKGGKITASFRKGGDLPKTQGEPLVLRSERRGDLVGQGNDAPLPEEELPSTSKKTGAGPSGKKTNLFFRGKRKERTQRPSLPRKGSISMARKGQKDIKGFHQRGGKLFSHEGGG